MRLCTRHSGRLCALVLYHLIQTRSDFFTIDRAFKKLQNDVKKSERKTCSLSLFITIMCKSIKSYKNFPVFSQFHHHNFIYTQNKRHIRNQLKNLSGITYVSVKNIFRPKLTCTPLRQSF